MNATIAEQRCSFMSMMLCMEIYGDVKIAKQYFALNVLLIAMAIVYSTTCFKKAIEFIVQIVMKNIRRNIYEA